ncbi:hypothetical protein ACIA8E_36975 [Streptomyces sp. NPDC051664]|uniref:hypothetical protein n=1 Tax=Streptomyces sp. NPDC051664 TaxID=3365668 RepID=UPI0037BA6444
MRNMRAEHVATETGTGLLWHVVDDNDALCARIFGGKTASAPNGLCDREDYCRSCMNAVAEAAQQKADLVAPNPGGQPDGC